MAVEIASAYVSIIPSARGMGRNLERELGGAGTTAGAAAARGFGARFNQDIRNHLNRGNAQIAAFASRAGLAVTAGIGVAGFFGIKTAADFEQTRIAFEGILGDVEEANKLLSEMRDFAAVTPFQFTDLTKSAQQLLAVGFTAEDIIPTMETLGNVAATLGAGPEAIEAAVRALGQMKGKGKVSAQELIQISEALPGFSAIGEIAEEMGVTTEEAFKLVESGAVSANEGIEAILEGMESFPGASGAMERQSKTLNGVISTFKDTLATTAIDFITPYLPALSDGVRKVGGFVEDLAGKLQEFLDSEGFAAFKDDVVGVFEDIGRIGGPVIEAIGTAITEIVLPAFADFVDWLTDHEEVIVAVIAGLTAAMVAYAVAAGAAAVASVIAFLPLYLLIAAVALLVAQIYYAWNNWDLFRESLTKLWAFLMLFGPQFIDFFRDLWGWASSAWNAITNIIDAVKQLIEALAQVPDKAPFLPDASPGFDVPGVPFLDDGGVMPGRRGVHYLAAVAGGETVLPTHKAPLPAAGGGGDTNIYVTQLPGEDAGDAVTRGLRKVRLTVPA